MRPLLPILLLPAVVGAASAQEPGDSVLARLERAERLIQMLEVQVAEQAQTRVATRSGNRVEVHGLVILNGFHTSGNTNNSDAPLFALPSSVSGGYSTAGLGGTFRQSRVGIATSVPELLGGEFNGELEVSFHGGHLANGRLLPLLAIRRLRAELRWNRAWVVVGQEQPPIAEVDPSSLAQMELPGFSASGNLWFWMPQVRVGWAGGNRVRVGVEGTVLAPIDPTSTVIASPEYGYGGSYGDSLAHQEIGNATRPDDAERSERPFLQARVLASWGDPGLDGGEVSVGVHTGWIATSGYSLRESRAFAVSARFFATRMIEIRGEAFTGKALNSLGGGGVAQNFGVYGAPVHARGGWLQLNVLPTLEWEVGAGLGVDDPRDSDLEPTTGRSRNTVWELHAVWRPYPVVVGLEYRRLTTDFVDPLERSVAVGHFNVAMGFEF